MKTLDTKTMTYGQLKELVPETPRRKMTAKKLEGEEVLFTEHVKSAYITIYKNGYGQDHAGMIACFSLRNIADRRGLLGQTE